MTARDEAPDEVEALALILRGDIGPEKGGLPWAMVADAYRSSARRAIAAGFHRQGQITADEREALSVFDPSVDARMHQYLVPTQGNPQRALRLAVHDILRANPR